MRGSGTVIDFCSCKDTTTAAAAHKATQGGVALGVRTSVSVSGLANWTLNNMAKEMEEEKEEASRQSPGLGFIASQ
ncbi:hypothetical protein ACLKA7_007391 [Drosophila subpalustris]